MTWLYHFTHIRNLSAVILHGLVCDASLSEKEYVNSGNPDIKARRKGISVPFGGTVADYVPFYFATRSPMLFTQYINGFVHQEDIIYLRTSVERICQKAYAWCCSDKNAAKVNAIFYNTLEDMQKHIRWDYMESAIWKNTDAEPDRKERRMAEFLVHRRVAWEDILSIGVMSQKAKRRVEALLPAGANLPVVVTPGSYFEE